MPEVHQPCFEPQIIHRREDGYWIDTFYYHKDDKAPGLIVSGLKGKVEYLENPKRTRAGSQEDERKWIYVEDEDSDDGSSSASDESSASSNGSSSSAEEEADPSTWTAYQICHLYTPVPMASLDITGNGYNDIIVGYNFGPTMINSERNGGDIIWLENPGDNPKREWKRHFIGRWPAIHRLAVGYFTQRTFPEIIAAPVVHGPNDKSTPVPLIIFQKPDNNTCKKVKEWRKDIVDDGHFRVIHEVYKKSLDGPHGLDSLLVASMDGIARLYYEEGRWKRELIGLGKMQTPWQRENTFFPAAGELWGAGTADAGKMGSDPFAYVAASEPFHGPYISLYTRKERGQAGNLWKRHVLDVYGTPTQKRCWGDGPVHNIVCADIDGDGNDEFLVSMFGPVDRNDKGIAPDEDVTGFSPNKGIWCYKILDLDKGLVAKWHLPPGRSSARCVVGDFCGQGKADLASISYHVDKYYREKDPVVTIYQNKLDFPAPGPQIFGTLWGGEGMVYLPRPDSVQGHLKKEVIEIANYLIQVEVIPPESEVELSQPDGIKVIFGSLTEDGDRVRRPLGGKPFPEKETLKPRKGKTTLQADARLGAIFLRLHEIGSKNRGPWKTAPGVPVNTKFELYDKQLKFPDLQFVKVEDLWWGGAFKKKDFWNLTGFHFRLQDNQQNLCHMQFWTAGPKVWAEYHDHHDNAFKELHTCLSQGTIANDNKKLGGMWAPVPSTCDSIIPSAESLSIGEEAFPPPPKDVKHCGLRPLEEHGRIWHEDATGSAVYRKNNTVSYPRHQWAADDGNGKYIDVWMALEFDAWLDFEL